MRCLANREIARTGYASPCATPTRSPRSASTPAQIFDRHYYKVTELVEVKTCKTPDGRGLLQTVIWRDHWEGSAREALRLSSIRADEPGLALTPLAEPRCYVPSTPMAELLSKIGADQQRKLRSKGPASGPSGAALAAAAEHEHYEAVMGVLRHPNMTAALCTVEEDLKVSHITEINERGLILIAWLGSRWCPIKGASHSSNRIRVVMHPTCSKIRCFNQECLVSF